MTIGKEEKRGRASWLESLLLRSSRSRPVCKTQSSRHQLMIGPACRKRGRKSEPKNHSPWLRWYVVDEKEEWLVCEGISLRGREVKTPLYPSDVE